MVNFSRNVKRKLLEPEFPYRCVLAVFLWRHPYKKIFIDKGRKTSVHFYHPVDKCFYTRIPKSEDLCEWQRDLEMEKYLSYAMKYSDELCTSLDIGSGEEVSGE